MNAVADPFVEQALTRETVLTHWINRVVHATQFPHENIPLYVALVKLSKQNPQSVANIYSFVMNTTSDGIAVRKLIKTIADESNYGMALMEFDNRVGRYRSMRSSNARTFRPWIAEFNDYEDWDDISDYINEDFVTCDNCGEYELRYETVSTWDNDCAEVCRTCINDDYTYSDYYDTYIANDDVRTALDEHGDECTISCDDDNFSYSDDEDCYIHHNYGPKIIGAYHSSKNYFSEVHSDWTKLEKRWLGVELEVECKDDSPSNIAENINALVNQGRVGTNCFFERDGSLSNGFEIITQPMGLDKHTEFWSWLKNKDATRPLLSHKTSTCGLHVHVTRYGLSKLQIAKIVTFVNSPDNRDLIEAISRRYSASHCRITNKKLGSAYKISNERYEAVNLQPRRTVEFRIFRGTLKYESLMSAIEFVNALVKYCHDQSGYGFDLRTDSFLKFINTPSMNSDTKHLRVYLDNRMNQD